jgi:hypothetical protein
VRLVDDRDNRITDGLDDLAAFLMYRTTDAGTTDAESLETFAVVEGYKEGDAPPTIEAAMRARLCDSPPTLITNRSGGPAQRRSRRPDWASAFNKHIR